MKKSKIICAALAAAMLAGCAANTKENETTQEALQSPTAMTTTTEEPEVQTSAETTTELTTMTEPTETSEQEPQAQTEEIMQPSGGLVFINKFSEENGSLTEVSEGNEFIDYKLIENYEGTKDIGELGEKAIAFVKDTEIYKNVMKDMNTLVTDGKLIYPATKETEITYDEYVSKFSDYISDDVIEPIIAAAYPDDYDGDGKEETYIIVEMPSRPYGDRIYFIRDFVIFSDKDGNMVIVDEISAMYPAILLDYGSFRHIIIGGEGSCGAEDHNNIYGVQNGSPVGLYSVRGELYKQDCFLSTFGWQSMGDFMYFDTVKQRYVAIDGVNVTLDEIREMDTTGVLADMDIFAAQLIGGKYYCLIQGMMDYGTIYTYKNDEFRLIEDSNVRTSTCWGIDYVTDINIDDAVANMKHID